MKLYTSEADLPNIRCFIFPLHSFLFEFYKFYFVLTLFVDSSQGQSEYWVHVECFPTFICLEFVAYAECMKNNANHGCVMSPFQSHETNREN